MANWADAKLITASTQPVGEVATPAPATPPSISLALASAAVAEDGRPNKSSRVGSGIVMTTEADPEKGGIGRIAFDLQLPDDFPEKYEAAIVRAVDQCTVKRHIADPPAFSVTTSRALPG